MIQTYEVCEITPRVVREIFDACARYSTFQAGICCSNFNQLPALLEVINEIEDESPPWYVEQVYCNVNGIEVRFQNGSQLDIFVGNEAPRRKRFHCLRVDSETDENLQRYVLRYMIRDYQFVYTRDGDEDSDVEDLLAFAESMLCESLPRWQREMLMCMHTAKIYVPGRSIGKQVTMNIYNAWKSSSRNTYDVTLTYDELMKQEK